MGKYDEDGRGSGGTPPKGDEPTGNGAKAGARVRDDKRETVVESDIKVPTISSVDIDTSSLKAVAAGRPLTIKGDEGAEVIVNIVATSGSDLGKFYNFTTNSFDALAKFNNENNLKATIKNGIFTSHVNFPASGGDSYNILVIAPVDKKTRLASGISVGGNIASKSISRTANAQVTFSIATDTAVDGTANYKTFPSNVTSTRSPLQKGKTPVDISWKVENAESDAGGFGLKLASSSTLKSFSWDKAWYFETTETVDGTTSSSTSVVVDDVTDLVVGMEMTYKAKATDSGGIAAAATGTRITAIDADTKTLTLSVANSLTDGFTMTFRAYGKRLIERVTGMSLDFGKFTATSELLTKTVRADSDGDFTTSTTITLNGTYGISGGNTVTYKGARVDNSAANAVSTVSASSSAGSIVVQNSQILRAGTKLTFSGSTQAVTIIGRPIVKKYPTSNRTVNLNLDKFITVGTDGS